MSAAHRGGCKFGVQTNRALGVARFRRLQLRSSLREDRIDLFRRSALAFDADEIQRTLLEAQFDQVTPPLAASGETCPMHGPLEAPEKRPSVIRAIERDSSESEAIASVVINISGMPEPRGPS